MGDAARLRKGLFDERLSVKPADWVDGVLSYRPITANKSRWLA